VTNRKKTDIGGFRSYSLIYTYILNSPNRGLQTIAMVVDQLGAIASDYSNSDGGENIIYFDKLQTNHRIRLIKIGLSLEGLIYIIYINVKVTIRLSARLVMRTYTIYYYYYIYADKYSRQLVQTVSFLLFFLSYLLRVSFQLLPRNSRVFSLRHPCSMCEGLEHFSRISACPRKTNSAPMDAIGPQSFI